MLVLSTLAVSSWIFWNSSFILDNFSNPLRCLLPHPPWFNLWPCSFYSGLLPVAICSWRQIRVREWNNNNKKSSEILKYLHWSCAGNEVYSLAVRSRFCVEDSGALADCEALQSWLQCLCLLLLRIWVLWMHSDNSVCSWKKRCNMWPFFLVIFLVIFDMVWNVFSVHLKSLEYYLWTDILLDSECVVK